MQDRNAILSAAATDAGWLSLRTNLAEGNAIAGAILDQITILMDRTPDRESKKTESPEAARAREEGKPPPSKLVFLNVAESDTKGFALALLNQCFAQQNFFMLMNLLDALQVDRFWRESFDAHVARELRGPLGEAYAQQNDAAFAAAASALPPETKQAMDADAELGMMALGRSWPRPESAEMLRPAVAAVKKGGASADPELYALAKLQVPRNLDAIPPLAVNKPEGYGQRVLERG